MKIIINEKQTRNLIKKYSDISEEETSTEKSSTEGGGSEGYPEVGKWESGATRGPANQIGNTKWSEVVGSTLKRDKANKLK